MATSHGLTAHRLGTIAGARLRLGSIDVGLDELHNAYESGLSRALEGITANA